MLVSFASGVADCAGVVDRSSEAVAVVGRSAECDTSGAGVSVGDGVAFGVAASGVGVGSAASGAVIGDAGSAPGVGTGADGVASGVVAVSGRSRTAVAVVVSGVVTSSVGSVV